MRHENSGSIARGLRAASDRDRLSGDPDGDIVALLGKDDVTGAVILLMQRHGPAVYRFCREALRDPTLAEDVHQQVFIAAFRGLRSFAGRSTLRIWLFAIARHRVLDAVKQRRRSQACLVDIATVEPPDPGPSPLEAIDDAQLLEALIAGLHELDEPARAAVLLRYQQGFTFDEMAGMCDEKAGTLHARVARALPRLRACIERLLRPGSRELTATGLRCASRRADRAAG